MFLCSLHFDRLGGIPARNVKGERLMLYLGIIDILQSYRFRKKLEHAWKSMVHDGVSVTSHYCTLPLDRSVHCDVRCCRIPSPYIDRVSTLTDLKVTSPKKYSARFHRVSKPSLLSHSNQLKSFSNLPLL